MTIRAFGMVAFALLALTACAQPSGQPRPTQAQELCKSWGYDPNDPACLRTFRRDPP